MTKKENARLAGLAYLIVVVTGIFNLGYVPSQLIAWDNATITVSNILASEFLFRAGIVSGVFCYISFLLLPLILYKLFSSVNQTLAQLMVVLAVTSVPISILNLVSKVDVLALLSGAQYLDAIETEQIHAQVMLLLRSYNNGILVVQIFWGLWLFPLGYLIFKSRYMPRIFGVLLMAGFFGYLIKFVGRLLFPSVDIPGFVGLPASIGEMGTCLWLLIMGVNDNAVNSKPKQESLPI